MEKFYELKTLGDDRGGLCVIENLNDVPFEIARVFYIYGADNSSVRGKHANRNSRFAFVCVNGSCKVKSFDGFKENEYLLDQPNKVLYMDKMMWKEMYDFSSDSVLLVLSDCKYDKNEYIYDKEEFINEVKKNA